MLVKATLCFNFGPYLVFVPVAVGTDETGAALATAVNITYKLVFTHTELEILDLIIYFKVYDPKQTTETQVFCVKCLYDLLRNFGTISNESKLYASF